MLTDRENVRYNYIKNLAYTLQQQDTTDLFLACVLYEKCTTKEDIKNTSKEEIDKLYNLYRSYVTGKDPLINPIWLEENK